MQSSGATASQHKVREDPDFEEYHMLGEPLKLWIRVVAVHTGIGEHTQPILRQQNAEFIFNGLRQYRYENIGDFFERYNTALQTLIALEAHFS